MQRAAKQPRIYSEPATYVGINTRDCSEANELLLAGFLQKDKADSPGTLVVREGGVCAWGSAAGGHQAAHPRTGRRARPAMRPDEATILKLRHLIEKAHGLTAQIMNIINDTLEQRGLSLKGCAMVDVTIIQPPPSMRYQDKRRDQLRMGMKADRDAQVNSELIQTASVAPANASDISQLLHLFRKEDRAAFGGTDYAINSLKRANGKGGVLGRVAHGQQTSSDDECEQMLPQAVVDPRAGRPCVLPSRASSATQRCATRTWQRMPHRHTR